MRKQFEQSAETEKLVNLFRQLKYQQTLSFDEATKLVGFTVTATTPAYQSAKRIVKRDHGVFIASVRGHGFVRGTGSDMVASGPAAFKSARNKMISTASTMLLAVNENLAEDEHRSANEMYARANIIISTTYPVRASSNAPKKAKQPQSAPIDIHAALKTIRSKSG